MIDLYYWTTPNGHKITMFLEEAGLEYTIKPVNIGKGDQFDPAFLEDLAQQQDSRDRGPRAGRRRQADQRVRVGRDPALPRGQDRAVHPEGPARPGRDARVAHVADGRPGTHARDRTITSRIYAPEKIPYAIDRYVKETSRLYARARTSASRAATSSSASSTRSPTWLPIRGSSPSARARTSTSSRTCKRWQAAIRARPATDARLRARARR